MDPLIVDSLAEAGLLLLGGFVLGGGAYYFVSTRLSAPGRRHAHIRAQLEAARARQLKRQVLVGPRFPRVLAHLQRIRQRAEDVLEDVKTPEWPDSLGKRQCLAELESLIRHCHELERVMQPTRRRIPGR